ncbi:hypothetical protein ACFLY6_00115 [Candidatus Dependentiae bacterium]
MKMKNIFMGIIAIFLSQNIIKTTEPSPLTVLKEDGINLQEAEDISSRLNLQQKIDATKQIIKSRSSATVTFKLNGKFYFFTPFTKKWYVIGSSKETSELNDDDLKEISEKELQKLIPPTIIGSPKEISELNFENVTLGSLKSPYALLTASGILIPVGTLIYYIIKSKNKGMGDKIKQAFRKLLRNKILLASSLTLLTVGIGSKCLNRVFESEGPCKTFVDFMNKPLEGWKKSGDDD